MSTARRLISGLAVTALAAGLLGAVAAPAGAVPTTAPPVVGTPPSVARAFALPTAQITGVAYAQVVVGDTVYVGGTFSKARPAGVAAGGAGEVTRSNLLAYSLTTGQLVPSFAPVVNNTVKTLTASPDGTRLYAGGLFTQIDGQPRYRIAAFDTGNGTLVASFKPIVDYLVAAIVATNTTVYFGGKFGNVSGVSRTNLAAVQAGTGAVLTWAPVADSNVQALVASPNGKRIFVAGNFANLNGVSARGLGAVITTTGATLSVPANQVVYDYGSKAAFLSLSADSVAVYATAYNFGGSGNFEGTVAINPNTGGVKWLEDCHGDTYSAYSSGATIYTVGHAHYCLNIGGFPQVATPGLAHRAVAFTTNAAGTVQTNQQANYANFAGQPAPSLRQWFPDLTAGTVTGQDQAAWSVTGSGAYVVMAGEFPKVGGVAQAGLVRFATAPTSPNTLGPVLSGSYWAATVTSTGDTTSTVSLPANWDRDDLTLTYSITRDEGSGTPQQTLYTGKVNATEWSRPTITTTDSGLTQGITYRYRASATDPAGNIAKTDFATFTVPGS